MLGWAGAGINTLWEAPSFIEIAGGALVLERLRDLSRVTWHAQARGKKLALKLTGPSAFPTNTYFCCSPPHSALLITKF